MGLPEEVVDHIYDLTCVNIDKQHIVIIPNPLIWPIGGRKPVVERVIDEEPWLEEQTVEEKARLQAAVAVAAERRVIRPGAVHEAIESPVIDPVIIAIAAPAIVPAAEIAPVPAITAAIIPAPIVAAPIAPVAPEVVVTAEFAATITAKSIPAAVKPVSSARIAGDIADLVVEPATASVAEAVTASIPTIDPVAAEIAPAFDPAGFDFTAAVNPVGGKVTPAAVKAVAAEIPATLNLLGSRFAAAFDAIGTYFAPTINAVRAYLATAVDLLSTLGCCGTFGDLIAKAARRFGAAFGRPLRRGRTGLLTTSLKSALGTAAAVF